MATSATLRNPPWLDGITFASQDARLAIVAALLASAGSSGTTGIAARPGVRPAQGNPLQVTASSGMNISIANGFAFVQGTAALDAGVYPVCLDTATTLTVSTADPSNPRIDNVCLTITDNGNNTSTFVVQIQAGTPAPSPSAPALPANSLLLATIQVNAGAVSITSGNITDQRVYTTSAGGILRVTSSAQYPTSGLASQYLHDDSTGRLRRLNGSGGTVPARVVAFAPVNTSVTADVDVPGGTPGTVVPVASATFTCDGATEVCITCKRAGIYMSTANPGAQMSNQIVLDSTQIDSWYDVYPGNVGNSQVFQGLTWKTWYTPAAGTHTVHWNAQVVNSFQDMFVYARSTAPAVVRVEAVSP